MASKKCPKNQFCSKSLPTMGASTWFLCVNFDVLLQSLCKHSQTWPKNLLKVTQNWAKVNARLKWMLSCPIHINLGCFEKVLWKLCKIFEKSHEKSQKLNHVLVPIEGKDWGQKFLLGIFLGVLEGLINRSFFWFSILTPSSVHPITQPNRIGQFKIYLLFIVQP